MEIVFNILVIAFIGLITYWWFNQGLLSALLHFVCVLCAGVLAFASWEPIASALFTQKWLEPYALGVALLGPFAAYLLVLRVAADKLAPDNLNFPQIVNIAGGSAFGLCAGVLTVGIALIGIGHTHSSDEILGVKGAIRTNRAKGQPDLSAGRIWIPAHSIAAGTFAWLSEGSMSPSFSSTTLASMRPQLAQQALSLQRDTFSKNGRLARTVANRSALRLDRAILVPEYVLPTGNTIRAYVVNVNLGAGATTEAQGFALSASQFRLVGQPNGLNTEVAYPFAWSQPNPNGGRTTFTFDDVTNYITGPAGTTAMDVTLVFPGDRFPTPPKYLMLLGQRLAFPAIQQESTMEDAIAMQLGSETSTIEIPESVRMIASADLSVNDAITPANVTLNDLGAMDVKDENYLFSGSGTYASGGFMSNRSVAIRGVWAPPNTRVLRLNISRGSRSSIDLWDDRSKIREEAGEEAMLALVDDLGRQYFPIGYIHAQKGGERLVDIKLARDGAFYKLSSFPNLSRAGADDLWALFTPAIDRKIVGIKLGDKWVARANLTVPKPM
jgi:hypothetical protein